MARLAPSAGHGSHKDVLLYSLVLHEKLEHLWGAAHPAVSTDSAGRKEPSKFGGAMEATSTSSSCPPAADRAEECREQC